MKVKAKVTVDLNDRSIASVDFRDKTLNSCELSEGLQNLIYNKVMKTPFHKYRKASETGLYTLDIPLMVFPKVMLSDRPCLKFRYKCMLSLFPLSNTLMAYSTYIDVRNTYYESICKQVKILSEPVL